jgi:hypothetical protein
MEKELLKEAFLDVMTGLVVVLVVGVLSLGITFIIVTGKGLVLLLFPILVMSTLIGNAVRH